jgi:hypothetical protein
VVENFNLDTTPSYVCSIEHIVISFLYRKLRSMAMEFKHFIFALLAGLALLLAVHAQDQSGTYYHLNL